MLSAFQTFAQDYVTYSYDTPTASGEGFFSPVIIVIWLITYAVFAYLLMRILAKAKEEPTWAAFVPIYSSVKLLKIAGHPWWWVLLMFIPFAGLIFAIIALNNLSKSFGHGVGYTLMFIFIPVVPYVLLAFGSDEYQGPAALKGKDASNVPPAGPVTPAV